MCHMPCSRATNGASAWWSPTSASAMVEINGCEVGGRGIESRRRQHLLIVFFFNLLPSFLPSFFVFFFRLSNVCSCCCNLSFFSFFGSFFFFQNGEMGINLFIPLLLSHSLEVNFLFFFSALINTLCQFLFSEFIQNLC